jgi:mannose-6-phosphate isomerase-like protein (cupin superfamily)
MSENEKYTLKNLDEVDDMAAQHGMSDMGEARFANGELETEQTGISFHRLNPNARQGFGHQHETAEEVYVVTAGSGRVKIDDDIIDLAALDAVRIAPAAIRAFEGGPDGMEMLAFGPLAKGDGEIIPGWWSD